MLVIFAITATSMLAVIGLLYTFGLVLAQRRVLQTAADAASLSGAWTVLSELGSDNRSDVKVLTSLLPYATRNGVAWDGTVSDTTLTAVYVDASGAALSPNTAVGSGGVFPVTARGVRVVVNTQVPTILPGFVKLTQLHVQTSAAAAASPTAPPTSLPAPSNTPALVLPIAVSKTDASAAYLTSTPYDLFAVAHNLPGSLPPTLNLLAASGAPGFGTPATNEQYWSDGQHTVSWQFPQPSTASLALAPYYDSIAAGLKDNVVRQKLVDASGAAYALVTVPVYDTPTATTVNVVGFAQLKIRNADITATSASGLFVPFAVSPGTIVTPPPVPDLGAVLVLIVS